MRRLRASRRHSAAAAAAAAAASSWVGWRRWGWVDGTRCASREAGGASSHRPLSGVIVHFRRACCLLRTVERVRSERARRGAAHPPPLPFVLIGHAASFTPY